MGARVTVGVFSDSWGAWTACRLCGGRVRWAETAGSGKRVMFDEDVAVRSGMAGGRPVDEMDDADRHECVSRLTGGD